MTVRNMVSSRHRSTALIALAVGLLAVLGLLVFTQAPWAQNIKSLQPAKESGSSKASIAWTPDHVSMNGNDTVLVTLTAQSAIPATAMELVPALAPYLSVTPATLPPLAKGATKTIQIVAKVPPGTPMDTIDGTLHLRAGSSTIARPLPITLTMWPVAFDSSTGLTINYPPNWYRIGEFSFSNVPAFSEVTDSLNSDEAYFAVAIQVGANPSLLPINDWFHSVLEPGLPAQPESVESTQIGGRQAIRMVLPEVGPFMHVYIPNGSDVITVTFRWYTPSFDTIYEAMLESLHLMTSAQ